MINVYIVGSKGIPARYGGFETFVENLTKRKISSNIHYFVSCMTASQPRFEYNNATCFNVPAPFDNPLGRIISVSRALSWATKNIKKSSQKEDKNIVYILGCRIGPLLKSHVRDLHRLNATIFCNPDGLEWKRDKWNAIEKKILKYCEKCLVLNSDFIICDSLSIQKYILSTYPRINSQDTSYIAYGSDVLPSTVSNDVFAEWLKKEKVSPNGYYLIVGRFVPENNYGIMIREFMASKTKRDLVIITNVTNNKFYRQLLKGLHFDRDARIKFVGTVYNEELLKKIRENAFAYLHGHSVGGTNPSLLEALGHTQINLLFDVPFNREVAEANALYFSSTPGSLSALISNVETNADSVIKQVKPKERILSSFSWPYIISQYESLFERENNVFPRK